MIPTKTRWLIAIICLLTVTTSFAQEYVETAKLRASVMRRNQLFASSVAISGDYVMVGAYREGFDANEENEIKYAGAVYVYKKIDNEWVFTQKLVQEERRSDDQFGAMVSIQGEYAVVGIIEEDLDSGTNGESNVGAAIIYKLDQVDGLWKEYQHIKAGSDGQTAERFGYPVVIKEGVILIGALRSGLWSNGEYLARMGAVYVFEKDETTEQWVRTQKIRPSDGVGQDQFGRMVDIQNDIIVIGANLHEPYNNDTRVGAAYVYAKDETGTWVETQKLEASNRMNSALFGGAVAISGEYVFVSAPGEKTQLAVDPDNTNEYGAVYAYKKDTDGVWQEVQYITLDDIGGYSDEKFGQSVSVLGNKMAISANEKGMNIAGRGACFIYELNTTTHTWELKQTLIPQVGSITKKIGNHILLDGNHLIVGDEEDNGEDQGVNLGRTGAAHIFELSDPLSVSDNVLANHAMYVYPNPVGTTLHIKTKDDLTNSTVIITDIIGRTVFTASRILIANDYSIPTDFSKGTYILSIASEGVKYTTKFVK